MSTTTDMPPPATKGRTPKKRQPNDGAPDPNADRADDYPSRWKIVRGKQTAKCMVCSHSLAGTKWCVVCEKCKKRICSPCWEGTRFNTYDEAIFEGNAQNLEGCWCRFPTKFDPKWLPVSEARAARMKTLMAAETQSNQSTITDLTPEDDSDIKQPVAKKRRLENGGAQEFASVDDYDLPPQKRAARLNGGVASPQQLLVLNNEQQEMSEQPERIKHLHKKTTVIIGAGVVGLAFARELAAATKGSQTDHEIIVVEKRHSYAGGASQHCAGLIAKHKFNNIPKGYGDLLELSIGCWKDLLYNSEEGKNQEVLEYNSAGVMHVVKNSIIWERLSNGFRQVEPPNWYNFRSKGLKDDSFSYNLDIGKISTNKFTEHLYNECKELDVKFRFHQEVTDIEKTKVGKLTSVDISRVGNRKKVAEVPCHNLIVAAGTHTLEALHEIVPWIEPKSTFVNKKKHCEWVRVSNLAKDHTRNVGLIILNNTEGVIAAAQPDNELIIASVRLDNKHIPFDESKVGKDKPVSAALSAARAQLSGFSDSTTFEDRQTIISTALNGLPHICKIPSVILDDRSEGQEPDPLGIYLAYGFGMYGTTMSLGVAVALRQMIMGDDTEIGHDFDYPIW